MTQSNFTRALEFTLSQEGGWGEPPLDDAPTNRGITLPTLSQWRQEPCTVDDLKNLSVDETGNIYRALYWLPAQCDKIPDPLAMCVFDTAVNSGVEKAIEMLQFVLGVRQDGVAGPQTIAAAQNPPDNAVSAYLHARLQYEQSLSGWAKYGSGWSNRIYDLLREAI